MSEDFEKKQPKGTGTCSSTLILAAASLTLNNTIKQLEDNSEKLL